MLVYPRPHHQQHSSLPDHFDTTTTTNTSSSFDKFRNYHPTFSMTVVATSTISVAASIVVTAAERIGDVDPQEIIAKLDHEKVKEDWQLEYLDSHQWQILGAPMGLVASIRRCLEERKQQRRTMVNLDDSFSNMRFSNEFTAANHNIPSLSPMAPKATLGRRQLSPARSPNSGRAATTVNIHKNKNDITHRGHSPCRSVNSSATTVLQQPPVMPTRKESQPTQSSDGDDDDNNNHNNDEEGRDSFTPLTGGGGNGRLIDASSAPPVLPQRLQSLETYPSESSLSIPEEEKSSNRMRNAVLAPPVAKTSMTGSYRQQAYGSAGWNK